MESGPHISILGGGAGGLSLGYYAKKAGRPFTIYEAGDSPGGNCRTLQNGDFRFDSGAHRFHDKDPGVTAELKKLLGDDLSQIQAPSHIFHDGKFVDFPLSPLNLVLSLGPVAFTRAGFEVLRSRLTPAQDHENFESFALSTYGRTIASRFLLNYSQKLWGESCDNLSCNVAGKRMQGLTLKTFLKEALLGSQAKTEHLDGAFYYPKGGFGAIAEKLSEFCGEENIRLNARITRIHHDDSKITALEPGGAGRVEADEVASTLPLDRFLTMLDPAPPQDILGRAADLRYRHMVLVALFLDKESVTNSATVYFPEARFPFTRVYEPRNRHPGMSPKGQTSLVAEIPCRKEDSFWTMEDQRLIRSVRSHLIQIGWMREAEIKGAAVHRMQYAYPVLELGFEEKIDKIFQYLDRFENLKLSGRNGKFQYSHVHDMMMFGRDIVAGYPKRGSETTSIKGDIMKAMADLGDMESLLKEAGVELVLLHGSVADGTMREGSDMDVALCLRGGTPSLEVMTRLQSALSDRLGREVDLGVVTTSGDPLFAFEALLNGQVLFQAYDEAHAWWTSLAVRRYDDTRWMRKLEREAVLKRFGGE